MDFNPAEHDQLIARAELYLCLAKLFSQHDQPLTAAHLQATLMPDLDDLSAMLPALTEQWRHDFQQALDTHTQTDSLLVEYSQLFLTPPAPAPLNLGYYIDGGLMGESSRSLSSCYQAAGLAREAGFHDLDDHLSLNLQYLTWLYAHASETKNEADLQQAAGVIQQFSLPAVSSLLSKVQQAAHAKKLSGVWPALVQLTLHQLQQDLSDFAHLLQQPETPELSLVEAAPATILPEVEAEIMALNCAQCGTVFQAEAPMATMINQLKAVGLNTAHMELCPACADPSLKPATLTPPGAKRFKKRA